jgi:hypothetical protein
MIGACSGSARRMSAWAVSQGTQAAGWTKEERGQMVHLPESEKLSMLASIVDGTQCTQTSSERMSASRQH